MRLERLADEREKTGEKIEDLLKMAEDEKRDLADVEQAQLTKHRERYAELEEEIVLLSADIERTEASRDVSKLLREDDGVATSRATPPRVPATTSSSTARSREFARDQLIVDDEVRPPDPLPDGRRSQGNREMAQERLERTLQNVTSTTVAGLINPTHMTEIMDIIDASRPVVDSGRQVPLDRGSMTYPLIGTRPTVIQQTAEKTEAGTVAPTVSSATADRADVPRRNERLLAGAQLVAPVRARALLRAGG